MSKILFPAIAGLVLLSGTASAKFSTFNVGSAIRHHHHSMSKYNSQHLMAAEKAITAAEHAARAGNKAAAEKDIAIAMQQVATAISTHKKHHTGTTTHPHHSHLMQAEKDLGAAARLVAAGNVKQAEKDLHQAAGQIRQAMQHHP